MPPLWESLGRGRSPRSWRAVHVAAIVYIYVHTAGRVAAAWGRAPPASVTVHAAPHPRGGACTNHHRHHLEATKLRPGGVRPPSRPPTTRAPRVDAPLRIHIYCRASPAPFATTPPPRTPCLPPLKFEGVGPGGLSSYLTPSGVAHGRPHHWSCSCMPTVERTVCPRLHVC